MKKNLVAAVRYNDNEDAFELWIYDNESKEYGFACSSKCRALEGSTETTHIHFLS